ncbi:hypothetical protein K435DRAFT_788830 [Dendrothele bispora CBS 962.96]|uniref:DUF6533 domain-containing protein n=1 Tax=Dendrothele bispora (strain CBS 962.96) TaxID=1314807 RepID=A0A4S8MVA5_DENBC|nr:hypothetical protein K435DRAFT_788830 [Dendrothele bispora CBS 962.96]
MTSPAELRAVSYLVGIQDELMFDNTEIQLVWKAPWKLGKLLYFLTRYLAFGGAIVTILLNRSQFTSLGTCKVLSEATTLILFLRVWAVWGNSWKVACLLAIGFLAPMPIMALYLLLSTPQYQNNTLPAGDSYESIVYNKFGFCPPFLTHSNGIIMMLAYLTTFETGQSGSHTSFIFEFFLYGLTYNIVTLASSAMNIIIRTTLSGGYAALFLALQAAMHSILTSRMLLHIRQEATGAALPTTQFSQSLRFASGPLNEDEFENDDGQRIQSQVSRQLVTVDEGQSWFGGPFERSRVSVE